MGRLDGRIAIVTGASSGVGAATMRLFAREGAQVVGVARRQAALEEVLSGVHAEGGQGSIVAADLSVEGEAQATVDATIARYGRVDVLVNCAGVGYSYRELRPGSMDPVDTTSSELWDEVMAINLGSAVHLIRLVVPVMREHEGGSIVNVASISGFTGLTVAHTYTAAKGALINLTRSLAITYARDGIRSNVVAPGFIDTPMVEAVIGMFDDENLRWQLSPMGRPATAEEIAYGCLFFASDESSYCNGSVLSIDGGITAKGA
jgi:meso-butanediol dehydrogenase / (S,S)-butanediol dehydrogenase / diacetyl reductase